MFFNQQIYSLAKTYDIENSGYQAGYPDCSLVNASMESW